MVIAAAGVITGAVSTKQGFDEAERLAGLSNVDVPGDFEIATKETAESARFWAWVGLGPPKCSPVYR